MGFYKEKNDIKNYLIQNNIKSNENHLISFLVPNYYYFDEEENCFIIEDIYCGLIYDPKLNNYLGLITTRDLMILYKYIIDNFPSEEITDFNSYIKSIFSKNKYY